MAAIVINNTALRNNGDVALVRSLGTALCKRGHRVAIAGQLPPPGETLSGIPVLKDLPGYTWKHLRKPVLADLAALWLLLFVRGYRNADMIIGAPGGYLNSFYGFRWKVGIYRWAKLLGKKTAIYSQSVGPLNGRDETLLGAAGNYLDWLVVRDEPSRRTAQQAGFQQEAILLSEDAIFLSPPVASVHSESSTKVLVSVREWRQQGRDPAQFEELVRKLVAKVASRGFQIEFVSTCQGIDGYIDDSRMADRIVDSLGKEFDAVTVCRDRLAIEELEQRIAAAKFVIGTRLHMCLLAILAGVPAFNISYETKGLECYRYMGLERYSVDYNANPDLGAERLTDFMDHLGEIRPEICRRTAALHAAANAKLNQFLSRSGLENVA